MDAKHRVFKLSICLPFFYVCLSSKAYKVENRLGLIFPAITYSFGTLILGFWGHKAFKSLDALIVNITSGEDHSDLLNSANYDDITNFVWNNLTRETSIKINKDCVALLLEIQEDYMESNDDIFSENNVYSLKNDLIRKGYKGIIESDINDFFDAFKTFVNNEN